MVTYVRDGYTTRPVLKPSDGFKAGPTALNPAGWLDIRPDRFEAGPTASNSLQYQPTALKPSGRLCNFLKTVLTASQISCISASSSSELQLARSHAGDRGVGAALLIVPSDDPAYGSTGLLRFLAVAKRSSTHRLTAGRSGKIKLAWVVFVAPPLFIALQRTAVNPSGRL